MKPIVYGGQNDAGTDDEHVGRRRNRRLGTSHCGRAAERGAPRDGLLPPIDAAVPGHDAVVVTLGIAENPLRVRLFGSTATPIDVRSTGTRNVIAAMRRHGVRRLAVQSSFGVGTTRDRLRWVDRLVFALLLKPQIEDTETQEQAVRGSGLEWVIAQPVHLTDDASDTPAVASPQGHAQTWSVSRRQVRPLPTARGRGARLPWQRLRPLGSVSVLPSKIAASDRWCQELGESWESFRLR